MGNRPLPAGAKSGRGGHTVPLLVVALLLAVVAGPVVALGSEPGRVAAETSPTPAAASSIRQRGPEAPVAPTPSRAASPTPAATDAKQPAAKPGAKRPPIDEDVRVWPLKAGSFTFTQPYGCVDQIGGFYSAVPGCPAAHPVFHSGIDLAAPLGTTVYAAAAGWVVHAGPDRATGLANSQIIVQHVGANDGYATEYLHWRASFVKEGDFVRAGQPIAEVGSVGYSTGPHLHFSVVEFKTGERIDPIGWLPRQSGSGVHLGLAPDAKRYPVAERQRALPDYADPSPPPAPKRERVPRRAPQAAGADAKAAKKANRSGKNAASAKDARGGSSHDGKRAKAHDAATATPAAKPERRRDRRNGAAVPTPAPETTPSAKERRRDRKAANPTVVPEPTAAWVNGYVPPVPSRPEPLLPGAAAPTPTPEPQAKTPKEKRAKRSRASKTGKRSAGADASTGKRQKRNRAGSAPDSSSGG